MSNLPNILTLYNYFRWVLSFLYVFCKNVYDFRMFYKYTKVTHCRKSDP